jgi:hypothetical protein
MHAVCVALETKGKLRNQKQPANVQLQISSTVTKGMADNAGYWLEILI